LGTSDILATAATMQPEFKLSGTAHFTLRQMGNL